MKKIYATPPELGRDKAVAVREIRSPMQAKRKPIILRAQIKNKERGNA
jgi:hypothetical protein